MAKSDDPIYDIQILLNATLERVRQLELLCKTQALQISNLEKATNKTPVDFEKKRP